MEDDKKIIIKSIENRKKEYIAYYKSGFLQATFCIAFKDNIVGAVALNRFIEMIKNYFKMEEIPLSISKDMFKFKSRALLDELCSKEEIK